MHALLLAVLELLRLLVVSQQHRVRLLQLVLTLVQLLETCHSCYIVYCC